MKKIEILLPEIANLYGELGTINYIKEAFKNEEVRLTGLNDEPRFASEDVDFIYMGALSERWQKPVLEKLRPHKERLRELIEKDVIFLVISTAFELFGSYIQRGEERIEGLALFDFYTIQDFSRRYNQRMILEMGPATIVGTKTQFSKVYHIAEELSWMKPIAGEGTYPNPSAGDGLSYRNFRGTHLTGPLLLQNPFIVKQLYELLGKHEKPLYYELIKENYEIRLENYKKRLL